MSGKADFGKTKTGIISCIIQEVGDRTGNREDVSRNPSKWGSGIICQVGGKASGNSEIAVPNQS